MTPPLAGERVRESACGLYTGLVSHARVKPRKHRLAYKIFMLLIDLDELPHLKLKTLGVGRFTPEPRPAGAARGSTEERHMESLTPNDQKGRVAVPMLMWFAGVPFTLVVILWLLFFRGH